MIVLGGIYPRPAATDIGSDRHVSVCDTVYSPIRLLDTSTYAWQNEYQPNPPAYVVPPAVSDVIGGEYVAGSKSSPQAGADKQLVLLARRCSKHLQEASMTPGFRPSSPARCRGRMAVSIAHSQQFQCQASCQEQVPLLKLYSQQLQCQKGCHEQVPLLKLGSIGLTSALLLEVLLAG